MSAPSIPTVPSAVPSSSTMATVSAQEENLRAALFAEAQARMETIRAKAKAEADRILQEAERNVDTVRRQRLEEAEQKAARQRASVQKEAQWQARRQWLSRQEECVEAVLREQMERACAGEGIDRARSLRLLAMEAMMAMGEEDAVLTIRPADRDVVTAAWGEALARECFGPATSVKLKIVEDASVAGGLILTSKDGIRQFDNTYHTRLERLMEQLLDLAVG